MTNTQRTKVRAFVRNHNGFEAWRVANGDFKSRDFTQDLLLKAIADLGLIAEVHDILSQPDDAPETETVATTEETETAMTDANADSLMASVIDPLSPFLSPTIIDTVRRNLSPIVDLALKPAVEKTVTVVQTVDKAGNAVQVSAPQAKVAAKSTLGKMFNVNRSKYAATPVTVWDAVDAPASDPTFVADANLLFRYVTALERGRNVWLYGPAGSGKSTLPMQVAAVLRRPFVRIPFQRSTDAVDLVGQEALDGMGGQYFKANVLIQAIKTAGCTILLDELTAAPPGLQMIIQTLLDLRVYTLPTGERVPCANGVSFVIGDNTNGSGDATGLYAGTNVSNAALVDRAARMIKVDYMAAALETQALHNHVPSVAKAACERIVNFVVSARKLSGFEDRPLSLRRMIAFVEATEDGYTPEEAFEDTFLTRMPDAERVTLSQHFKAAFDPKAYAADMVGTVHVAASDAPEQVAARGVDWNQG